jgi:signal transduction histidine kinase
MNSQQYEHSVFISYARDGESEETVNQIDRALQQRGLKIIREKRDLGYKGSISAFMERLAQGNCVIVIISDQYLRSSKCMLELVEIAEGKEFHDRVFPVVLFDANIYDPVKRLLYVKYWEDKLAELDQAMRGVGQANLQGIREEIDQYSRIRDQISGLTSILKDMNTLTPDLHKDSDFNEIYAGIERRMAEAPDLRNPETGESPYMGLRYFDTSDADLFYGRARLTNELLGRIQKEIFLAIVGASGSGKSSVVRAGLVPAWKAATSGIVHVIMPTEHPLESLAASLTRESESVTATSILMDDLMKDPRSLRLYVRKLLSRSGESSLLLLVDQFEETFTLCKDLTERKAFIENLLLLADGNAERGAARVVITLRADFYHHCFEYEGLRLTLEKHQANIGAMDPGELRQAIIAPAKTHGWDFQPGLVDLILQDVGTEPGGLPLLSHSLLETWRRRQGRMLTLQGYHEAGGVKKAIAQTAENVYDHLSSKEKTIARNIFLRLTELGEGTQDTRRRVKMETLIQTQERDAVVKVLKTLTDARLVTTEQDSAEVAHEALIREWETLRKWLDEDREKLMLYQHLTESAQEWEHAGRDETFLNHRGGRLDDIVLVSSNYILTSVEQEYLDACLLLREKEAQDRERRQIEHRQYQMLQAALEIVEATGSTTDLEEILDKALEKLHKIFDNANIIFLLYDMDINRLKFAPGTLKYYEIENSLYKENQSFALNGKSIATQVASKSLKTHKQEFIVTTELENDPEYLPLSPSTRNSELCASLVGRKGDLIGVIVLERAMLNGFDQNDVALVEIVARQLGLIFERVRLFEELRFKETVATQSAWALEVTHELNRTIGYIKNNLFLLRNTAVDSLEAAKYLDEIDDTISEISGLVLQGGEIKEIALDEFILRTLIPLARQRNIELTQSLNSEGTKIRANPRMLERVFKQLMQNASRAMATSSLPRILIRTKVLENSVVEIVFQDYGPGISESVKYFLFQRPVTTKENGGFGLLITRQIVEDMGGTIRVLASEPQTGAAFSIRLPVMSSIT